MWLNWRYFHRDRPVMSGKRSLRQQIILRDVIAAVFQRSVNAYTAGLTSFSLSLKQENPA